LLERWAAPRWQAVAHLGLIAVALALLPIGPAASWKPQDGSLPTWRILWLLVVVVGLPYLALSATSPLVQVWFSRSYPGRSPYRLYAVSNFGSLAALVSYPFLFEPAFTLPVQSRLWSGAFVLYAGLGVLGVIWMWRMKPPSLPAGEEAAGPAVPDGPANPPPTWRRRAMWLILPGGASLMFLATTNHVCQDMAVVPLLWVVPLALYLLSFIICFDRPRWYLRSVWAILSLTLILTLYGADFLCAWTDRAHNFLQDAALCFGTLLAVCMVCHGELVRLRPDPRRLTEFYLWIAAGGALGGMLVCLVAPRIFKMFLEWPIGLILSYLLAAAVLLRSDVLGPTLRARLAAGASVVIGLAAILGWQISKSIGDRPITRVRNFYGVVSVFESDRNKPAQHNVALVHGGITHGLQYVDPAKRRRPTSYYAEPSGVGLAIRYLQRRPKLRVGVIGLGAGTLAAYARPGDQYQFYEINPQVPRLAKKYFRYLKDCRGKYSVVPGDARLSLERQPSQHFDLLVLDAFSGDAIPTHLLTREAFAVYLRHLAAGGVIAAHITNKYLDLAPVVRAAAEDCKLGAARVSIDADDEALAFASDWMLLSRDADFLGAMPAQEDENRPDFRVPMWTDHYSNLFQVLTSD
jgi:protein-L-isoaspartate O-methyltransferase